VSDYEALQRRRNLIVGIFVVAGLLAFGWMVFKFGDLPTVVTKLRSFEVYVQFPSAPGVEKDTPVRFCGYQIGRVTRVFPPEPMRSITQAGPAGPPFHQVLVVMSIEDRYTSIPIESKVRLVTRGLGSSYIDIQPPPPHEGPAQFLSDGVRVQGTIVSGGDLLPEQMQQKLESLAEDISRLTTSANAIIGDPNVQDHIKQTCANLANASGRLIALLDRVDQTIGQVQRAIKDYQALASAGRQTLTGLDQQAERLVTALVQTTDQLGAAAGQIGQVLAKINQDQGTVGRLINDARLYEELLETATQFQIMTEELTKILQKLDQKGLSGIWRGSRPR